MSDRLPKILDAMDDEHRLWLALVGDLGEFEATRRAGTRWSPVDTLVHVTSWNVNALRVATSQATADAPALDPSVGSATILGIDVEEYNRDTLDRRKEWTLARAIAWAEEVYRDLRLAVEVLPSDRVIAPDGPHGIVGWLLLPAIEHPPEHRLRLERQLGYTP